MGVTSSRLRRASHPMGPGNAEEILRLTYVLFYFRVRAIQILYEEKIGSTSKADKKQWEEISGMIRLCDKEIKYATLQNLRISEAIKDGASHLKELYRKLEANTAAATHAKLVAITAAAKYLRELNREWEADTAAASHLAGLNRKLEADPAAASNLRELERKWEAIKAAASHLEEENRNLEVNTAAASDLGELNRELIAEKAAAAASSLEELNAKLETITAAMSAVIVPTINRVSRVFDGQLLRYLQGKVDLMKKLEDCLPSDGPISDSFVSGMNIDSSSTLRNVEFSTGLQVLLTFKVLARKFMSKDPRKSGRVSPSMSTETIIKVFYATNRGKSGGKYNTENGKKLEYGVRPVSIPREHQKGKVESPNKRGFPNDFEHFKLGAIHPVWDKSEFLNEIEGACEQNEAGVLLYIHGYNVRYTSALKRAAQLKHDLEFEGQVILYSWPTMEKWWAYDHDGTVILETVDFLKEFITTILSAKVSKVHILAHSMGNRALIEVLKNTGSEPSAVLENVILAAADENLAKFEAMLAAMHNRSSGPLISVYSSAFDWPLFASECFQWKLRLGNTYSFFGDSTRERNWPKVDVVDASGVEYDNVQQHSYHAEAREVLDDIQKLLNNSDKPSRNLKYFRYGSETHGWGFHAFVSSQWEHRWNMSEISPEMVISDKMVLTLM